MVCGSIFGSNRYVLSPSSTDRTRKPQDYLRHFNRFVCGGSSRQHFHVQHTDAVSVVDESAGFTQPVFVNAQIIRPLETPRAGRHVPQLEARVGRRSIVQCPVLYLGHVLDVPAVLCGEGNRL